MGQPIGKQGAKLTAARTARGGFRSARAHGPSQLIRRIPIPCSLVLFCLLAGCGRSDHSGATSARPLTVVISGDTAGWLMPCGCTANQSGGLLRRATYLDELGKLSAVIYADVGGAAAGVSDYHKVKFEAILAGEQKMGLAAHNIGKSEAAFGAEYLRDVARRRNVPLLSTNVRDAAAQPLAPPVRLISAGGRRIALFGVLSPRFAAGGLAVAEPRQAILDAAGRVKGQYDAMIVLAYLPQDELEQLAASLPEADAVVGGPTGQAMVPRRVGPTLLAAATNKGKFLIELSAPSAASASGGDGHRAKLEWTGKVAEMSPSLADHPDQQAVVKAYLAELDRRDFTADQTGLAAPAPPGMPVDYRIAGTGACAACHRDDHTKWAQTNHARAWETLRARQFHVDAYCQQCHTTGFALPGGFASRRATPEMVSVGCEDCHGPSQAHVQRPETHTPFAAADQCVRCHDHENSPTFVYTDYWPRIQHGKQAKTAAGAFRADRTMTFATEHRGER